MPIKVCPEGDGSRSPGMNTRRAERWYTAVLRKDKPKASQRGAGDAVDPPGQHIHNTRFGPKLIKINMIEKTSVNQIGSNAHHFNFTFSISMTACSTVAALGMMPLCLYLYTSSWNLEQNLTIPYQNIGITLVCLTIPVAFGVCVNYRWPKQSKVILKIGAILGGVLIVVVAVAGVVLAKGTSNSDITLLTISFIFPLIGHVTGFLLALLTHQSWQRCRTISLETGAQNIQMCVTMLQLSFTAKDLVQMLSFPLAYGLFQLLDGFLIVAAYKMYKTRLKSKDRRKSPGRAQVCHKKKSASPKETSAFLEVNEEAAVTPGPSGPVELHTALGPTGCLSSCA
ncbi:hypothetical protein HPG69_001324 [Diceros bicornis minor]|uniref:Solute carrier family 10 member 6 n=1 Tax=Diceros bicornis minor TaxID=77932 RepID=A0A7J7FF80_DICBM|nr:hypothetical protein HPG69_001324 [Diceros bicornis minor]